MSRQSRRWFARQQRAVRGRGHRGMWGPGVGEPSARSGAVSGATLPLSLVSAGETVVLNNIRDETRLRQRVADLGLTIGLTVRVVKNDYHGPLIIAVKEDSRLAVDRELAHRIQTKLESQ